MAGAGGSGRSDSPHLPSGCLALPPATQISPVAQGGFWFVTLIFQLACGRGARGGGLICRRLCCAGCSLCREPEKMETKAAMG